MSTKTAKEAEVENCLVNDLYSLPFDAVLAEEHIYQTLDEALQPKSDVSLTHGEV